MSDYTRVQFGALEQGQSNFQQAYTGLKGQLDDLEKNLESNLSQWEGSAVDAYWQAKAIWDKAVADVANVLNSMSSAIGESGQNYGAAEKANTSIWSG